MNRLEPCPGFSCPGFESETTTRDSGDMRDAAVRAELFKSLRLDPAKMLALKQVHSDIIIEVASPQAARALCGVRPEADGWLLSVGGYGALVYTADCVPLFIRDASLNVLGIVHAGWRGVAKKLPQKLALLAAGHSKAKPPFYAFIGPHIKECCFEIKEDCASLLGPEAVLKTEKGLRGDMSASIRLQLTAAGIPPENIFESPYCTCCETERFFSYRRDHGTSGIMSFVFKP